MVVDTRPAILVVDDEAPIREALVAALAEDWVVYAASCGAEACALLQGHAMAAIILDLVLQNEYGLDLVVRLRALSLAPILILTGHSSEDAAIGAIRIGVQDYPKKPFTLSDLEAALRRLVPCPEGAASLAARTRGLLEDYPPKAFRATVFARQMGVSEVQLRRCFRAAYGMTPAQYLLEIRLQRASGLLCTTSLGLGEIAFQVGVPNTKWFRKCFKRHLGVSPKVYRSNARVPTGDDRSARCARPPC